MAFTQGSAKRETKAPIDSLIPNPKNDKVHPPAQIERIRASYRAFGQTRPILARKENRMLIAGHGVHAALKEEGATTIDVIMWDVDQHTADGMLEADNRTAELALVDPRRRRELVLQFAEEEWDSIGFDATEVDQLLEETAVAPLAVREIETGDVEDTFWITCTRLRTRPFPFGREMPLSDRGLLFAALIAATPEPAGDAGLRYSRRPSAWRRVIDRSCHLSHDRRRKPSDRPRDRVSATTRPSLSCR